MGGRSGAGDVPTERAPGSFRREVLVLAVVSLWCFDLAVHFDVVGAYLTWARRHQAYGLDEVFAFLVVGFFGVAALWWRRHLHGVGSARDLDRTRRALAVTTERFRSLFEYHPNAVFSVDFAGRFLATNAACERLTGYGAGELREMSIYDLLARGYLADTETAFSRAREREPQQLEAAIVHADGHLVELALTGLPIVVEGEVIGVYGIAEDITERKRVQRELVRTRVEAEQANEAKSLFLANVSNEIRNPLSGLVGTTELLRGTELDESQLAFLDNLDRQSNRMLALASQIFEFSRFEVGKGGNAVPFDVRLLVGEVAALMRPQADRKGLFFKCTVDPRIPPLVHGDPTKIAQVLTNLLDNAVKFTESGWVRLIISSAHHFGDRVSVRFEVHDSGIGVSKDQERRLYLAYRQVPKPADREYDGSGLGLAISQQLVTSMGGTIALSSAPGLGSAFSFTLRFEIPPDPRSAPSLRPGTVPVQATSSTLP
jgi:PAS domain S-box-containing protein